MTEGGSARLIRLLCYVALDSGKNKPGALRFGREVANIKTIIVTHACHV